MHIYSLEYACHGDHITYNLNIKIPALTLKQNYTVKENLILSISALMSYHCNAKFICICSSSLNIIITVSLEVGVLDL
jgi:hypothetical protein